jgi:hypothetical protein
VKKVIHDHRRVIYLLFIDHFVVFFLTVAPNHATKRIQNLADIAESYVDERADASQTETFRRHSIRQHGEDSSENEENNCLHAK